MNGKEEKKIEKTTREYKFNKLKCNAWAFKFCFKKIVKRHVLGN